MPNESRSSQERKASCLRDNARIELNLVKREAATGGTT